MSFYKGSYFQIMQKFSEIAKWRLYKRYIKSFKIPADRSTICLKIQLDKNIGDKIMLLSYYQCYLVATRSQTCVISISRSPVFWIEASTERIYDVTAREWKCVKTVTSLVRVGILSRRVASRNLIFTVRRKFFFPS